MKVILKENVENLGKIGDIVKVSEGYARNFLLPRNLVLIADDNNIKSLEHHQKALSKKAEKEKEEAQVLAKKLEQFSCTITRKVGENEKLFGSVSATDVADVLKKAGFAIEKRQIHLNEPIKQLGVFSVSIRLATDVSAKVKVWVVQEK